MTIRKIANPLASLVYLRILKMKYLLGFVACLTLALLVGCGVGTSEIEDELTIPRVTPAVFNESRLPTVELSLPGLHCESCKRSATELIHDANGVADYKFDLSTKTLTIAYQGDTFDDGDLVKTLNEGGFEEASVIVESVEKSVPALEIIDGAPLDESK